MSSSSPTLLEYIRNTDIIPIAHRGASLLAGENSTEAFRKASELGYKLLETDIHGSKDGTAYIFHDDSLERLTGDNRNISDLRDSDIDSIKIKNSNAIPRLSEVFEEFPENYFNLDAKTWQAALPMAKAIKRNCFQSKVCIGSFKNSRINLILEKLGSETCHSMGTSNVIKFYLGSHSGFRLNFSAQCIQLPIAQFGISLMTKNIIKYAKKLNIKIHFWTINDAPTIKKLLDLNVNGIMTDDCILLKELMLERGKWPQT